MKVFWSAIAFSLCFPLCFSSSALAQTTDIRGVPVESDTTISITKGKGGQKDFEIAEGSADISGDPEVLTKAARSSWKQACEEWKKELKELNKENQILALSCNTPKCITNGPTEITCQSKGTYKVRTRVR